MTTKREYLKQQGITVGARGRFSSAAKQALSEATQKGLTFTAEKPTKKQAPYRTGRLVPFRCQPPPYNDIIQPRERGGMARKRTPEEKLAEVMKTAMDNTNFNAPLVANYLINFAPHYTQDKVMELIEALLTYQYMKYNEDWDMSAETSYGLIKARDWFRTLAENDQLELEMYQIHI